jgi:predicted permease
VFAALTMLSLALGIGANTAIFSVVHAVLLRPLPYQAPDQLVMIWSDNTRQGESQNPVSPANFEAFRAAPSFERVEAMYSFLVPAQIRIEGGEPEIANTSIVTPGMFALLGRAPLLGRTFESADEHGVVMSYPYWQRRFAGDPGVVGRTATVSGSPQPLTILGVMPEDFVFPYRTMLGPAGFVRAMTADAWVPLSRSRDSRLVDAAGQPSRTIHYLGVLGRLRPEATLDAAQTDLDTIARDRASQFPETNDGWRVTTMALHRQAVGAVRPALLLLLGGVGLVLLITCINVANVMLARATGRQHDLAIQTALGASGGRLLQQSLVESLLLAITGGLLGIAVAAGAVQALLALAPSNLPRLTEVQVSLPVLMFALLTSIATGIAVGAMPALAARRASAQDALRESSRTTASASRRRLRSVLIVAEVALAMLLAVGAGLLLRSFLGVLGVDPGFRVDGLLTLQMNLPANISSAPQVARLAYYDQLEARLRALPGVTNVGGTTRLPLGSTSVSTQVSVEGRELPSAQLPEVELRREVFDLFGTMDMPIVRGRRFTRDDGPGTTIVGIVNQAMAARVFPQEDPIGRRIRIGPPNPQAPWITVIGVAGNVRHGSLEETPKPELYLTYRQNAPVAPFLALRTAGDPAALTSAVREAIRSTGANPPFDVRTMSEIRSESVAERRFVVLLVGAFGVLALVLASAGVYGVVTLVAAERLTEMGIRLALGARPTQVLQLVLGQALRLAAIGVVIGGAVALVFAPALQSQLFGVGSADPVTYAGVAATLLVIAAIAAYAPARRAMRVDPARTLRPS